MRGMKGGGVDRLDDAHTPCEWVPDRVAGFSKHMEQPPRECGGGSRRGWKAGVHAGVLDWLSVGGGEVTRLGERRCGQGGGTVRSPSHAPNQPAYSAYPSQPQPGSGRRPSANPTLSRVLPQPHHQQAQQQLHPHSRRYSHVRGHGRGHARRRPMSPAAASPAPRSSNRHRRGTRRRL